MPTIIYGDGKGGLTICNPDKKAKIGRWCRAPLIPDRCDSCFDPKTLAHYPAEYFFEEIDFRKVTWRYGACSRCRAKIKKKLHKITVEGEKNEQS